MSAGTLVLCISRLLPKSELFEGVYQLYSRRASHCHCCLTRAYVRNRRHTHRIRAAWALHSSLLIGPIIYGSGPHRDAVLASCSAAHREALEQTSSAAVAASQEAARKHERSQRVAIARCLRRLGCQVDSAADEAVELVAVSSTSYGATTVTPRAAPPPVAAASTAPKPGRRRGEFLY